MLVYLVRHGEAVLVERAFKNYELRMKNYELRYFINIRIKKSSIRN